MAAIDLIVLGMIKQQPQSAYELQKNVEYRNISRWVKNQHAFHIQEGYSAGGEGISGGGACPGGKYAGEKRLPDNAGGRTFFLWT